MIWVAVLLTLGNTYSVEDALYLIPEKKIAICAPSKTGCAYTIALINSLNNKPLGWSVSKAKALGWSEGDVVSKIYADPEWTKMVTFRDPVERFKSAVRSKCFQQDFGFKNECTAMVSRDVRSMSAAVDYIRSKKSAAGLDRHIHEQAGFCYNISAHLASFQHQYLFDHRLNIRRLHGFLSGFFPEETVKHAADKAHRSIPQSHHTTGRFRGYRMSTADENFVREFYANDYNTFPFRPQPNIELLIPTTAQKDIAMRQVESFWKYYHAWVRIADDGERDESAAYAKFCRLRPCVYTYYGKNKGLSFKRNRLAEQAETELVFFADADLVWTENSDLLEITRILLDGADLVAMSFNKQRWIGSLTGSATNITFDMRNTEPYGRYKADCVKTDIADNAFLTRRSLVIASPWPEEYKMGEHMSFFLKLKQTTNATVVQCKNIWLRHERPVDKRYKQLYSRNSRETATKLKKTIIYPDGHIEHK
jgi:glycosyltransferase involved in cell wall biosynthesis